MAKRIPKNYDGARPTGRQIQDFLPTMMGKYLKTYQNRGELIMMTWPDIIGKKFAAMTHALSFKEEVLTVQVTHSTLLSVLAEHEKPRLLRELRRRFPTIRIQNIRFVIG